MNKKFVYQAGNNKNLKLKELKYNFIVDGDYLVFENLSTA
jgi:hypothetical protein